MAVTSTTAYGVHTLGDNNANRTDFQRSDFIDYQDDARTPLMAYYDRQGSQKASKSDLIYLFSCSLMSRSYSITDATPAGTTAGATAADNTVTTTVDLVTGMIALVYNGATSDEGGTAGTLIYISAVDAANTEIDYTNLSGGTIAQNDEFVPIEYASADDATTGPAFVDREPDTVTGYLAILKRKVTFSITERDTAVYAASDREQEKIQRSRREFMRSREANAWFSRATTDVGNNKIRTSMGIHEQLAAGITWIDGGQAVLGDFMLGNALANGASYFDTSNFAVFHGKYFLSGLFKLGMARKTTRPGDTHYGFKASTIDVAQYSLSCVHSQLFDVIGEPFCSIAVGLDLDNVTNWYLKGEGKMQLKRNTNDVAAKEGESISHMWRVQEGISITTPTRHFAIHSLIQPTS